MYVCKSKLLNYLLVYSFYLFKGLSADDFFNRPDSEEKRCPVMRSSEVWTSVELLFVATVAVVMAA